jgi:hypothetical protein
VFRFFLNKQTPTRLNRKEIMKTQRNVREYNEANETATDTEGLVEHYLTNYTKDEQRLETWPVDFHSPSRALIHKEYIHMDSMQEDAVDCARKLTLLIMAREASKPSGISRANACAALRITSAIRFHCRNEKLDHIGRLINKDRRVVSRHSQRFISWARSNSDRFYGLVTPEKIREFCCMKATSENSAHILLEELRIALSDLLHELISTASLPENHKREVFLQTESTKWTGTFELTEMFDTFTLEKEA